MGFLDSIGTLLGGFHDLQMADKYGPDWRRQKEAADFALQQQRAQEQRAAQEFERKQQEASDVAASEAALAPGAGEDIIGANLPPNLSAEMRKFRIAQRLGKSAQAKSNLAQQKFASDLMLRQLLGEQRTQQIAQTGEQQQALARVKADLEAGREASPRDLALIQKRGEIQTDLFNRAEAGRNARAAASLSGGKPQLRQVQDEHGNTVWKWLSPGEEARAPATAVERQASGMAQTVKDNVAKMETLANDVTSGPIAGTISKGYQKLYPGGKEADFDFLANAVIDTVYVKSGKQINQTEMQILKNMIPDRAKGNLPEQVQRFKSYANSLLQKYGAPEEGGGGAPRKHYRLKPGANPDLKSSYEEVP